MELCLTGEQSVRKCESVRADTHVRLATAPNIGDVLQHGNHFDNQQNWQRFQASLLLIATQINQ